MHRAMVARVESVISSVLVASTPVTAVAEPRLERGRYLMQSSVAYLHALPPK